MRPVPMVFHIDERLDKPVYVPGNRLKALAQYVSLKLNYPITIRPEEVLQAGVKIRD